MFGFLRDDGRFFYVSEAAASDSNLHYALSGNYFVVDGGAGGSGICRSMYLFKYDKDSMRLLDKIEEPDGGDFSAPRLHFLVSRGAVIWPQDRTGGQRRARVGDLREG